MDYEQKGFAIASLVCGIVSCAIAALAIPIGIFWLFLGCVIAVSGIITGIVGIVLGVKGKHSYGSGRAVAGFILGIIGTSLHTILFICFFVLSLL